MGILHLITSSIIDANKAIKQSQARDNNETQTVAVENRYSIEIPSFLSPTTKLSEDAAIQYYSKTLDISFMVIDESKEGFIKEMNSFEKEMPNFGKEKTLLDNLIAISLSNIFDINKIEILNYTHTSINGLNAVTLNTFKKRTFLEDALYGSFAFIEGKETLYQIIILSGGTSITKLAKKLELSIKTFKEL
ncbi:MAG: hypothetical protein IJU90_01275 [Bacteroidales bacterium]|nr:hypothetical protein [Bacteroidales bacterium]